MTLFELGYLDLIKALFFGKKISLTLGNGEFAGAVSAGVSANGVAGSTSDFAEAKLRRDKDQLRRDTEPYDPDWNRGKMWTDPYHVNPFAVNPFDRM